MEKLSVKLKQYISERIPKSLVNVLWQLINGIDATFNLLDYKLSIFKREQNILTAAHLSSLYSLASNNGFKPTFKIPSKGTLLIKINSKLFNRIGYPLFIKPFAKFTDKQTKLTYFLNSDRAVKIDSGLTISIPVVEGELKVVSKTKTNADSITRVYLQDTNIADGSISILVNDVLFVEVQSFYDNEDFNNNKLFIVRYSTDIQNPIVIYIKGLSINDVIRIQYHITNGELGNISGKHEFEFTEITDNVGRNITLDTDELTVLNESGFGFGSNGSDENTLRAAIGFNHGINILFDNLSYQHFLNKFSTLLIQKIINPELIKQNNLIYVSKRQALNLLVDDSQTIINQYLDIVILEKYVFTKYELLQLSTLITDNEYCLSSHTLFNSDVTKFSFQLLFNSKNDLDKYALNLKVLLYKEFSMFLHNRYYILNLEILFDTFMKTNNMTFEYTVFNSDDEKYKLDNKLSRNTPYIISHQNTLPIIKGDFEIANFEFKKFQLFNDINIAIKE